MSGGERAERPDGYESNVFVNCPFDEPYLELLRPLLFTVVYLGYTPRIASERSDSGENRLDKICGLVHASRYSIHDLSRLKSSGADEFYRLNMPFELGIDYGARQYGPGFLRDKKCLVLEKAQHDFKRALSDLSGIDIKSHKNSPADIVRAVRDWFYETVGIETEGNPSNDYPRVIWNRFNDFATFLYEERIANGVPEGDATEDIEKMPVAEYIDSARRWVAENVPAAD